jgi:clan AA aspartic protease
MGTVYEPITLKNAIDVGNVKRGYITEAQVHEISLMAMVDTGAGTLVINEELRQQLGLEVRGLRRAAFANEAKEICAVTDPVEVHWKDRFMTCQALVVSGAKEVLLGAIPLEDMDLMVDMVNRKLTGVHGDEAVSLVK